MPCAHKRLSALPLLYADEKFNGVLAFVSVASFFRTKVERVQTRTKRFFNKALKTLAGVNDTELSVYLNRKATAWYRRFPPMHSPDRTKDTKKAAATVTSGNEQGEASSASENDDDAAARPVASGSEDEPEGWGQE